MKRKPNNLHLSLTLIVIIVASWLIVWHALVFYTAPCDYLKSAAPYRMGYAPMRCV